MKLLRCLLAVSLLCGAALVSVAPALARGHLDPSFGDGGVVDLASRPDSSQFALVKGVRVGPEEGIFFLEEATSCDATSCSTQLYLRQYTRFGTPGLGRVEVGRVKRDYVGNDGYSALAIDHAGRPLVALTADGLVTVKRFTAQGALDSSFGTAGSVQLRCDCYLDSIEARPGNGVLLLGHTDIEHIEALRGTSWFVARMDEGGSLDPGFGDGGIVQRAMKRFSAPAATLSAGGGALLYGFNCCSAWTQPFVQRWTSEGDLQRRYAAKTKAAISGLRDTVFGKLDWEGMAVMARSRGRVDVIGEANEHGVVVRLRRDGSRDRTRSRRSPWRKSFHFLDAAADGFGGTFVLGATGRQGRLFQVIRLQPDGRYDRRFGAVDLPGAYNEGGAELLTQGRGGALVFSAGLSFCRQSCPPQPKLFRLAGVRG